MVVSCGLEAVLQPAAEKQKKVLRSIVRNVDLAKLLKRNYIIFLIGIGIIWTMLLNNQCNNQCKCLFFIF